jgi:hypothetical protein
LLFSSALPFFVFDYSELFVAKSNHNFKLIILFHSIILVFLPHHSFLPLYFSYILRASFSYFLRFTITYAFTVTYLPHLRLLLLFLLQISAFRFVLNLFVYTHNLFFISFLDFSSYASSICNQFCIDFISYVFLLFLVLSAVVYIFDLYANIQTIVKHYIYILKLIYCRFS